MEAGLGMDAQEGDGARNETRETCLVTNARIETNKNLEDERNMLHERILSWAQIRAVDVVNSCVAEKDGRFGAEKSKARNKGREAKGSYTRLFTSADEE